MITLSHITKHFTLGTRTITALSDISVHVPAGQIYDVIGAVGEGKNTLICCINLLEWPTSGSVVLNGTDLPNLPEQKLIDASLQIGMIFQHFNLLASRTPEAGNVSHCRWNWISGLKALSPGRPRRVAGAGRAGE